MPEKHRRKVRKREEKQWQGFPREGAAELDLPGRAEESARWKGAERRASVRVQSKTPLKARKGAGKAAMQGREAT